jgi:D-sedoheptulose 7-phosphate isomerase
MRKICRRNHKQLFKPLNIEDMNLIKQEFLEAKHVLDSFMADEGHFSRIENAAMLMVKALQEGHKIISCGNGGSMCDAMHFAEELTGQFRNSRKPIAAVSISDPAHLSCTANDFGFEHIFSRYVEAIGQAGDVLLAISTSGNSENVVRAASEAKTRGMKVVGLTGKEGGRLAPLCDVEIRAPKTAYSDRTQEIHIKVIHSLIHYIELNI